MNNSVARTGRIPGSSGTTEVLWQTKRTTSTGSNCTVAFFEGDQIDDVDTQDLLGRQRWSPDSHLETICERFGPEATVLVVKPTATAASGQACYGNFLTAMTATGEPLGFRPQDYPAATHLAAILAGCHPQGQHPPSASGGPAAAVSLVGFSKGAVVLNQLLTEMAWREEALQAAGAPDGPQPAAQAEAKAEARTARYEGSAVGGPAATPAATTPATAAAPTPATNAAARRVLAGCGPSLPPEPIGAVLDSIRDVHYLDAGLNCRGVHLTDPAVVASLGRRARRRPLVVHLHGTPRQWGDRKRPWIAQERDRFLGLLGDVGVSARVYKYFEGQPPSLRQHFDVIAAMRVAGAAGDGSATHGTESAEGS